MGGPGASAWLVGCGAQPVRAGPLLLVDPPSCSVLCCVSAWRCGWPGPAGRRQLRRRIEARDGGDAAPHPFCRDLARAQRGRAPVEEREESETGRRTRRGGGRGEGGARAGLPTPSALKAFRSEVHRCHGDQSPFGDAEPPPHPFLSLPLSHKINPGTGPECSAGSNPALRLRATFAVGAAARAGRGGTTIAVSAGVAGARFNERPVSARHIK